MASHYENYGGTTAQSQQQHQQHQQKPFIDFYRQGNQSSQDHYQLPQLQQQQQQMNQQQQQFQQQQQMMMQQQQQFSGNINANTQSQYNPNNFGSNSSSQNQYPQINLHSTTPGGINVYQSQQQQHHVSRDRQSYEGGMRSGTGHMLITSNEQLIDFQQHQQDPSPINAVGQAHRFQGTNGAFGNMGYSADTYIDSNFNTIDTTKKDQKQIQIDRNVANKRRSIENKEAITGANKQKDLLENNVNNQHHTRQLMNGAKSALANYGTQGQVQQSHPQQQMNAANNQAIKQINKNAKVERDPVMELNQQQFQNNSKRSLAKSQSQNRLVLLSQDALHKNNPYQDQADDRGDQITDKNSFFKDQVRGPSNQSQELLYKQHMQYSGGHQNTQKGWLLKASSNNLVLSRMTTKSECTFCNKTSAGGMISQSYIPHHCSSIYCSKDQQGMMIQNNLSKKYSTNRDYYNLKIVNDLIYNENTHIVSIFKDYLILDDINEFLKRSYTQQETKVRLPKLCSFYEKYSQVFPNYVVLPESKYMFKNIQRKQKLIDEQYQLQEELAKKQHQTLLDEDKLFNTKFYNSYYSNMGGGGNGDLSMSRQQYEHQAKTIAEQIGKKPNTNTRIDQMKIDELVDRFLMKDSESNIQLLTSVALDFSEFQNSFVNHTQQSHSKISMMINNDKTATKNTQQTQQQKTNKNAVQSQQTNKVQIIAQQQQTQGKNQQPQINMVKNANPTPQIAMTQGKKSLDAQQKRVQPQNTLGLQNTGSSTQGVGASATAAKQQKNSFNKNQQQQQQQQFANHKASTGNLNVPKQIDTLKTGQIGGTDSSKTTPRLQKGLAHATNLQQQQQPNVNQQQPLSTQDQQKPVIQTSPCTKEAIATYLQDCNIDQEQKQQQQQHLMSSTINSLDQHYQSQKLGMGSLLSPTSTNLGSNNMIMMMESPQMKSPNFIGPKYPLQNTGGSQSSLLSSQQQFHHNSLSQQSRQNMKSQLVMPTVQSITSMKKSTTRLSNGGTGLQQKHHQTTTSTQRKNASPAPSQQQVSQQNQNQCVVQTTSRNQHIVSNSTQKSAKSNITVTGNSTHTKFLSGGNEQYQKLLVNINSNSNQQQQNSYVTSNQYDTINSNIINSSNKKNTLIQPQRSKQDQNLDELALSQGSHSKQQPQPQVIQPPEFNDNLDNEAITGEDCDDFGIADERFASPDANKIIFQTLDDNTNIQNLLSHGRMSLEGGTATVTKQQNPSSQILLITSTADDRVLANTNNYDQIKKHLEQYITVNNTNGQNNNMVSLPSQHTFDMNTIQSNSKRYNVHVKSSEKYDEAKQSTSSYQPQGYNREGMTQSATSNPNQNSQDQSNSRNGTQKKQFESLKQKIRGQLVTDTNQQQQQHTIETHSINSTNKTPNKSSTHSKKSTTNHHHIMGSTQQMILQQNRMSLESNQVIMMMPNSNTHQGMSSSSGLPMTATSANGRQLSFSQTSFSQNANNYRSITNLQQRKGSNNTHHATANNKELSIESKRLSGQHRQSFKDINSHSVAQQQQQQNSTSLNDKKVIKRSATGKMLHIQDANSHSHNFGHMQQQQTNFLQSVGSSQSFQNPNFMSNSHITNSNKLYATSSSTNNNQQVSSTAQIQNLHHQQQMQMQQQQQQAANQVRVMTPSYSLASLSKLITPTTTTSPMTMTVSLANGQNSHVINRKQVTQKSVGKSSALGVHSQTQHLHNPSLNANHHHNNNTLQNSHSQNILLADKNNKMVTSTLNQKSTVISSKANVKQTVGAANRQNNTVQHHPIQISTTISQKIGRHQQHPANHHQLQANHSLNQQQHNLQTFQATPRGANLLSTNTQQDQQQQQQTDQQSNQQLSLQMNQKRVIQPLLQNNMEGSSQNLSCTVSTENNNSSKLQLVYSNIAAKAIESNKHPKFMKTIEEYGNSNNQGSSHQPTYNTMLSASIGHGNTRGGGHTLTNSLSQAQLEVKNQKNKIQTVVNSNQASIKRQTLGGASTTLSQSGSVSHFKSPSQQINTKKQLQGRYLNM